MIYQASLTKYKKYWWDEDKEGECRFAASSDEEAKQFISTAVLRMNRHYEKMKEPREVSIRSLSCLEENGFSLNEREIDISHLEPMQGVRNIFSVLKAFYPKNGFFRSCIAISFTSFDPTPHS